MQDSQLEDQGSWNRSSSLLYCVLIALQTVLFLGAAAALTLFYLSYRSADFTQIFIITGLVLIGPWLLISLLPVFWGLQDRELRREILARQLISMAVICAALIGLSFFVGFHQELWQHVQSMALNCSDFARELWRNLASSINKAFEFLTTFISDKALLLFSS